MQTADYAIQDIKSLYDKGLYLQAYHAFGGKEAFCDRGTIEERVLLARLAGNLGNSRLGDTLRIRAYRLDRAHPEAVYNFAWKLLGRDGLLTTYEFLRNNQEVWKKAEDFRRAEATALYAKVHAYFRDFTQAYKLMDEARRIDPSNPWVAITHAEILETEDKLEESLRASQEVLAGEKIMRYATQHTADLLVDLNRDEEAIALLYSTGARVESCGIWGQLSALLVEHKRFDEALTALEKGVEAAPLRREKSAIGTAARKFEIYYGLEQFERAREEALKVTDIKYYEKIAERLKDAPEKRVRKVLPVGFVRQHHDTCAPATLAAISTFLQKPADHLAIADEICYGGTPDHLERRWAAKQGFVPREFRVTWESTVGLIDLGLPFTLTTVGLTSGHLQAVIGYDDRCGTLVIRDPNTRQERESLGAEFFEAEKANGPRGMVLVPPDLAAAVDALNLPCAAVYDEYHAFRYSLDKHDRATAAVHLEKMLALEKDNYLTLISRRSLAVYDANTLEELDAQEQLLKQAPEDTRLLLGKLRILGRLDRTEEQIELLRTYCATKGPNPVFLRELSDHLSPDARRAPDALRLIRRALRMQSTDASNLRSYASLLWRALRYEEALPLYRFAVCVGGNDESHGEAYFMAARFVKETEHALGFLRERCQQRKDKSGQPAQTLYWALECIHRQKEAFSVLDEAIRARPEDGDLLCYAADVFARYGNNVRADELMAQAEKKTHPMYWLRISAHIARYRGDYSGAIALWRKLLELNPTHSDAQDSIADLLAETQGEQAALEHLRLEVEKFPQNIAVLKRLSNRLRNRGHGDGEYPPGEKVLQRLIEVQPEESWNHRQLAIYLSQVKRAYPEAIAAADHALELEPSSAYAHQVRAIICHGAGRLEEARKSFRQAISLDVDLEMAISKLVAMGETRAQKLEELTFIHSQLSKQAVYGAGLMAYREAAYPLIEPEDLLKQLRVELRRNMGLWQAHVVVARQLADMRRLDEALTVMQETTRLFPLYAVVWMELALIHFARHERSEALAMFREALVLRPAWGYVSRRMAQICDHERDYEEAARIMESAVALAPFDALNHYALAVSLRKLGRKEKAWEHLLQSARIEPNESAPFDALPDWCEEDGTPDRAIEFAKSVTEERPGDAVCWLNLADLLTGPAHDDAFFAAVDKALSISPKNAYAYDIKAMRLCKLRRYDEAAAACVPESMGGNIPVPLRGRGAWVKAERGDIKGAAKAIRELLTEQTDYLTGWKWLADWTETLEDKQGSLEACKRLVHLDPQSFQSFGYLGFAHLAVGEEESAMKEFAHAFALRPSYGYAGFHLLNLQIKHRQDSKALESLNQLIRHCPGSEAESSVIQLATAVRGRGTSEPVNSGMAERPLVQLPGLTDAINAFHRLCRTSDSESARCIANAAKLMREATFPWSGMARKELAKALSDENANWSAGWAWFKEWDMAMFPFFNHVVMYRAGKTAAAAGAFSAYVSHYGEKRDEPPILIALYLRGPWLRQSAQTWGRMGYALLNMGRYNRCVAWMHDWKRKDAQSWMLMNLSMALQGTKRYAECYEVSQYAVTLDHDNAHVDHFTFLAVEDALNGRYDKAREYFAKSKEGDNEGNSFLRVITQHILKLEDTPQEQRAEVVRGIRANLYAERLKYSGGGRLGSGWYAYALQQWAVNMYNRALKRLEIQMGSGESLWDKSFHYFRLHAAYALILVVALVFVFWMWTIREQRQKQQQQPAAAVTAPAQPLRQHQQSPNQLQKNSLKDEKKSDL